MQEVIPELDHMTNNIYQLKRSGLIGLEFFQQRRAITIIY
jgi:hypothetical protein